MLQAVQQLPGYLHIHRAASQPVLQILLKIMGRHRQIRGGSALARMLPISGEECRRRSPSMGTMMDRSAMIGISELG